MCVYIYIYTLVLSIYLSIYVFNDNNTTNNNDSNHTNNNYHYYYYYHNYYHYYCYSLAFWARLRRPWPRSGWRQMRLVISLVLLSLSLLSLI